MELRDIYDRYKHKTGNIHQRGNPMKEGDYHMVVHIWIVNDKREVLIQKRQPWKDKWPNMWDSSAAGCAIKGDDSKSADVRETKEELGIDLDIDKAEHLFTVKFSCGFDDVWAVRQNVNTKDFIPILGYKVL
jgi:isopentenyldiphosphate isomerase